MGGGTEGERNESSPIQFRECMDFPSCLQEHGQVIAPPLSEHSPRMQSCENSECL